MSKMGPKAIIVGVRTFLIGAATLAVLTAATASAQIVPETSGQASAANSPAAVVQTGSRKRLSCADCTTSPETGWPVYEAWLDEPKAALGSKRPAHLR